MAIVELKIKPLSQNEWCLLIIFEDENEWEIIKNKLTMFETYLHINDNNLNIVFNLTDIGEVITLPFLITNLQKGIIESKSITYLALDYFESGKLPHTDCFNANIQYR